MSLNNTTHYYISERILGINSNKVSILPYDIVEKISIIINLIADGHLIKYQDNIYMKHDINISVPICEFVIDIYSSTIDFSKNKNDIFFQCKIGEYFKLDCVKNELSLYLNNNFVQKITIDSIYDKVRYTDNNNLKEIMLFCAVILYEDFGSYIDNYIVSKHFHKNELKQKRREFYYIYNRIEKVCGIDGGFTGLTFLRYMNIPCSRELCEIFRDTCTQELINFLKYQKRIEKNCNNSFINRDIIDNMLTNVTFTLREENLNLFYINSKLKNININ